MGGIMRGLASQSRDTALIVLEGDERGLASQSMDSDITYSQNSYMIFEYLNF